MFVFCLPPLSSCVGPCGRWRRSLLGAWTASGAGRGVCTPYLWCHWSEWASGNPTHTHTHTHTHTQETRCHPNCTAHTHSQETRHVILTAPYTLTHKHTHTLTHTHSHTETHTHA